MQRDAAGRPILDPALEALATAFARAAPEALGHLDPRRILFVAGAARLESRASIRPLGRGAAGLRRPRITLGGRPMAYEIALRPRFFLDATPEERLLIVLHELWHISPRFDGTLAEDRRHHAGAAIEASVGALLASLRPRLELGEAGALLAHQGELRLSAWRVRPPSRLLGRVREDYDERDLYPALLEQR